MTAGRGGSTRWLGRGLAGDHWATLDAAAGRLTVALGTAAAYRAGGDEGRALDAAIGLLAAELGRSLEVVSDDGSLVTVRHVGR